MTDKKRFKYLTKQVLAGKELTLTQKNELCQFLAIHGSTKEKKQFYHICEELGQEYINILERLVDSHKNVLAHKSIVDQISDFVEGNITPKKFKKLISDVQILSDSTDDFKNFITLEVLKDLEHRFQYSIFSRDYEKEKIKEIVKWEINNGYAKVDGIFKLLNIVYSTKEEDKFTIFDPEFFHIRREVDYNLTDQFFVHIVLRHITALKDNDKLLLEYIHSKDPDKKYTPGVFKTDLITMSFRQIHQILNKIDKNSWKKERAYFTTIIEIDNSLYKIVKDSNNNLITFIPEYENHDK